MIFSHVIIGGGILGLLLAKRIKDKYPEQEVVLFEKKNFVGEMASSRNSGVLHAGLYYPNDSLKLKHCINGNRMWRDIAQEFSIPILSCGKYIVSTNALEDEKLKSLFEKSIINNIPGMRWVSQREVDKLSQYCNVTNAFFSASTGVIDIASTIKKLEVICYNRGVHFLKNDEVIGLKQVDDSFIVTSNNEVLKTHKVYNCAGVEAPKVRKYLGLNNIDSLPVKGNYVRLKKRYFSDALIYPIPPDGLKGLGIHTSFDSDGIIRFGPDTEDIESIDNLDFTVSPDRIDDMLPGIQSIFKDIRREDLIEDYAGVRAKIIKDGELFTDFIIGKKEFHGIENYYELLGIESPGMTSSPSLIDELLSN